jgi:hypothetical protein
VASRGGILVELTPGHNANVNLVDGWTASKGANAGWLRAQGPTSLSRLWSASAVQAE